VFLGDKGGFFTAFSAAPQVPNFSVPPGAFNEAHHP
jgi:hypothetical protein